MIQSRLIDVEDIRRELKPAALLEHLRRNLGLRLISVLLAIGLWVFVNAGQHGSMASLQVPISYRDLPPGFVIVNPHPDFVKIQVSGPRTLLSLIDPGRLTARLDLTGVGVGQASFKLGPDTFNVPRQTNVTSISPSQIVLDIDKIVTRELPVHLDLAGKVASGYKVASTSLVPPTAEIRGPSREVSRLDNIDTEPCTVSGANSEVSCEVGLVTPGSTMKLDTDAVNAKVTVAPLIADREFHGLPVEVRDSGYKFRIEPRHINLTVRGPAPALAKLDLRGSVYVEANGIAPGNHDVPVQVDLPDGVELVRQSPEKVKLRMYRQKEAGNG
ncbi:MAG: CdaR family protein [Candidatus Binataceae bacterium]